MRGLLEEVFDAVGEDDGAIVFTARRCLREHLVPVLRVGLDDERARAFDRQHRHPLPRNRELNSDPRIFDDLGIDPIERDHETLRSIVLDDASIAEVQAEQVRV